MCFYLSCVPFNHIPLLGYVFLNWSEFKTSTCVICEETSLCLPPPRQIIHHTRALFTAQAHTHTNYKGGQRKLPCILLWGLTHTFSTVSLYCKRFLEGWKTTECTNFIASLQQQSSANLRGLFRKITSVTEYMLKRWQSQSLIPVIIHRRTMLLAKYGVCAEDVSLLYFFLLAL